jgi:hypothetical protein
VYQYETGGTRKLTYDGSGQLLDEAFRTEKVERASGDVITETVVDGKLKSRATSHTTADGSHTENVYYSSAGSVTSRQIRDTGSTGESAALAFSDGSSTVGSKDAAGNVSQIREESNGRRMVTTSNANGRKVEYYNADGKLTMTLTMNYSENDRDEHGNWIRATQYITRPNSEPKVNSVTTRKITYYE